MSSNDSSQTSTGGSSRRVLSRNKQPSSQEEEKSVQIKTEPTIKTTNSRISVIKEAVSKEINPGK